MLHQPAVGLAGPWLTTYLDVLGQIPLGELGDGGRRLGGIEVGVFPGLDAGDHLDRLGAGLLRRDDAVAPDRDALRLSTRPRPDDADFGPGGIHAHAEPLLRRDDQDETEQRSG